MRFDTLATSVFILLATVSASDEVKIDEIVNLVVGEVTPLAAQDCFTDCFRRYCTGCSNCIGCANDTTSYYSAHKSNFSERMYWTIRIQGLVLEYMRMAPGCMEDGEVLNNPTYER